MITLSLTIWGNGILIRVSSWNRARRTTCSIREIVEDQDVGANFVVLLIVKLADKGELLMRAYTYLPNGTKSESTVAVES